MTYSDSHIRKLVMLARKRITARRISFVELKGITVSARHHLAHRLNRAARDANIVARSWPMGKKGR
jgi:hypothetical protein